MVHHLICINTLIFLLDTKEGSLLIRGKHLLISVSFMANSKVELRKKSLSSLKVKISLDHKNCHKLSGKL